MSSTSSNNPPLTSKLYFRLPRELRNDIYTYLLTPSHDTAVIVRPTHRKLRTPSPLSWPTVSLLIRKHTDEPSLFCSAFRWTLDPIHSTLLIPSIKQCPAVAREVLETYFSTRTFVFSDDDIALLPSFLSADLFKLSISPRPHAKRVRLLVLPLFWAGENEKGEACVRFVVDALGAAHAAHMRVSVHLDLQRGSLDDDEVNRRMEQVGVSIGAIVRAVEELRAKGGTVRLERSRAWGEAEDVA